MFAKNQAHRLNQIPAFQFPAYFSRALLNAYAIYDNNIYHFTIFLDFRSLDN